MECKLAEKITTQTSLADTCESQNLKTQSLEEIKMFKSESKNTNQCENLSLCDEVTKYLSFGHNGFYELLSSVEQWDIKYQNQYKNINTFECLVCCFKTDDFNKWKTHIMSMLHMSCCDEVKDLYSYVCSSKGCKVLMYGFEKSLNEHTAQHSVCCSIIGMPTLMAEVMTRYITKQKNKIYYCSHCKKFDEKPIHSKTEISKTNIKCPVKYFCKYCNVDFYSSPEMIDCHSLSVEHLTLKCFDELRLKTKKKKNSQKIKLCGQPSTNVEKDLLAKVENEKIVDSVALPNLLQNNSLFENNEYKEVNNLDVQTIQVNESLANVNVSSTSFMDQKSQEIPLNDFLEEMNVSVHNSESQDNKLSYKNKCEQYTRYFKHKLDILNILHHYNDFVLKTLAYYCNVCDFVTEEKYTWDKHIETKHYGATTLSTVRCSVCSLIIFGGNYEEHTRSNEHCSLLKKVQLLKPVKNDLIRSTELIKSINSSTLDEMFVNPEKMKEINSDNLYDTGAETLDDLNSENSYHGNNDCILKFESLSTLENLSATNALSPNKVDHKNEHMKSAEVLKPDKKETTMNKNINEKFKNNVASFCGETASFDESVTNLINEEYGEIDEDKAYGAYVTQRLKNIKNSTVKQEIQLEIDYLFYTQVKNMLKKIHKAY